MLVTSVLHCDFMLAALTLHPITTTGFCGVIVVHSLGTYMQGVVKKNITDFYRFTTNFLFTCRGGLSKIMSLLTCFKVSSIKA